LANRSCDVAGLLEIAYVSYVSENPGAVCTLPSVLKSNSMLAPFLAPINVATNGPLFPENGAPGTVTPPITTLSMSCEASVLNAVNRSRTPQVAAPPPHTTGSDSVQWSLST
jgi:hypothetical protein